MTGPSTMFASIASATNPERTTHKMGSTISAGVSVEPRIGCSGAVPKKDASSCGSPEETFTLSGTVSITGETTFSEGLIGLSRRCISPRGGLNYYLMFNRHRKLLLRFGCCGINSRSSRLFMALLATVGLVDNLICL